MTVLSYCHSNTVLIQSSSGIQMQPWFFSFSLVPQCYGKIKKIYLYVDMYNNYINWLCRHALLGAHHIVVSYCHHAIDLVAQVIPSCPCHPCWCGGAVVLVVVQQCHHHFSGMGGATVLSSLSSAQWWQWWCISDMVVVVVIWCCCCHFSGTGGATMLVEGTLHGMSTE